MFMTENEKICMAYAMHNFRKAMEEEDDDAALYYEEDAIVLYVTPGEPFSLMEEGDAIDEILMAGHNGGIRFERITDSLQIAYPVDSVRQNRDGSVVVTGPVYISHPVVGEVCMDLSAVELMEAVAYLATHQVKIIKGAETVSGYLLKKED